MKFKILRVIITAILLIVLCACSAQSAVAPTPSKTPERTDTPEPAQTVAPAPSETPERTDAPEPEQTGSYVDVSYLLYCIADSGKKLESFPAFIISADTSKDGCVLHLDRLKINPDYEPGSLGDELYLINESEVVEDIKVSNYTFAEYDAKIAEIGPDFVDYLAGYDGAQFTVFMLGNEVLFLSEITVP